MKKVITEKVQVEVFICNICNKEVTRDPWDPARINIVRNLFKTQDFHAHATCLNKITRDAFAKYFPKT